MTSTVRYFDDRGKKTIPGRASLVSKDDYDALAAELAEVKKMYAYEGRKAMIEAERAEAANARIAAIEAKLAEIRRNNSDLRTQDDPEFTYAFKVRPEAVDACVKELEAALELARSRTHGEKMTTLVERIAEIVGYCMATQVARNNQPDMSGDPRRRIPQAQRRAFDDACLATAEAILEEIGASND